MSRATGYVIVDKATGTLDWDGELHKTVDAAIQSLTDPWQEFADSDEDAAATGRKNWRDVYEIRRVGNAVKA